MSGSTEELRGKIAGAGDLEGVVRSMKALAASSIGQYERAIRSLADYRRNVEWGFAACLRNAGPVRPAAPANTLGGGAVGAVLFGSDQGLVGGFNEILMDFARRGLAEMPGRKTVLWAVGERIEGLIPGGELPPAHLFPVPVSVSGITPLVGRLLVEIDAAQERGEVASVYLFHNEPGAGAQYQPVSTRLLPMDPAMQARLSEQPWPTRYLPEVIDGPPVVLPALIRAYLFVTLFQACSESLASENASRLAAMQRAEKNIEDILDDLNRVYHRVRQEQIDEELFDVISGYSALTAGSKPKGIGKAASGPSAPR